jgi:hypothetical protein
LLQLLLLAALLVQSLMLAPLKLLPSDLEGSSSSGVFSGNSGGGRSSLCLPLLPIPPLLLLRLALLLLLPFPLQLRLPLLLCFPLVRLPFKPLAAHELRRHHSYHLVIPIATAACVPTMANGYRAVAGGRRPEPPVGALLAGRRYRKPWSCINGGG